MFRYASRRRPSACDGCGGGGGGGGGPVCLACGGNGCCTIIGVMLLFVMGLLIAAIVLLSIGLNKTDSLLGSAQSFLRETAVQYFGVQPPPAAMLYHVASTGGAWVSPAITGTVDLRDGSLDIWYEPSLAQANVGHVDAVLLRVAAAQRALNGTYTYRARADDPAGRMTRGSMMDDAAFTAWRAMLQPGDMLYIGLFHKDTDPSLYTPTHCLWQGELVLMATRWT